MIEEIVQVPDFVPTGVVTNDGDGLHPDFDDHGSGTGRRIPSFSVDARNHDSDGSLSSDCPAAVPFAQPKPLRKRTSGCHTTLQREIVTRANTFCLASGSSTLMVPALRDYPGFEVQLLCRVSYRLL